MARQFNATYYYSKKHLNYNVPTREEYELHKLLEKKNRSIVDVSLSVPANDVIQGNIAKCWRLINSDSYGRGKIACSISGGSDSDVLLDMTRRCDPERKIYYYFLDTGLEAKATKEHLDYLQLKYQVKIHRFKANAPIPLAVRKGTNKHPEYAGIPFISKQVSEFLQRLQKYGFEYDDSNDLEMLCEKYCIKADANQACKIELGLMKPGKFKKVGNGWYKGCVSALQWWCNAKSESDTSMFNINRNTWLKEFLIQEGGVPFKVANKCCKLSKKDTSIDVMNQISPKLSLTGVRKSEGGTRAAAYKSCFNDASSHPWDEYRPLFWFLNADKKEYEEYCGIKHSKLYQYLTRTGCSCCPFSQDLDAELNYFKEVEPNMYKAVNFVFGPSYEFTKKYHEFQKMMKRKEKFEAKLKELENAEFTQMNIFDYVS